MLDVDALVPVVSGAEGDVTVAPGVCAALDDLRSEYEALPERLTQVVHSEVSHQTSSRHNQCA